MKSYMEVETKFGYAKILSFPAIHTVTPLLNTGKEGSWESVLETKSHRLKRGKSQHLFITNMTHAHTPLVSHSQGPIPRKKA